MVTDEKDRRLDEWLDAGLKQYGRAEPRSGVEDRILAHVRAQRARLETRKWRWWPALAVLAAMIAVGTFIGTRTVQRGPLPIAVRSNATPEQKAPVAPSQAEISHREAKGRRRATPSRRSREPVDSATPRQEQFPSPQPLSEQEKILARYVQHFPQQASLMAQAQMAFRSEQMSDPLGSEISPDTEKQNP